MTARAVAPLATLAEYAAPLLEHGGVLVAWKGARDAAEEEAGGAAAERLGLRAGGGTAGGSLRGGENRHLHLFSKVGPVPAGIPRRPGWPASGR